MDLHVGYITLARHVEHVTQFHLSDRCAAIEYAPQVGPEPLLDPVNTERCARSARSTLRDHPVKQPVANTVAGKLELDPFVTVGPELLPDIVSNIVRVYQFTQLDRD